MTARRFDEVGKPHRDTQSRSAVICRASRGPLREPLLTKSLEIGAKGPSRKDLGASDAVHAKGAKLPMRRIARQQIPNRRLHQEPMGFDTSVRKVADAV